jgi:hypothetical protein
MAQGEAAVRAYARAEARPGVLTTVGPCQRRSAIRVNCHVHWEILVPEEVAPGVIENGSETMDSRVIAERRGRCVRAFEAWLLPKGDRPCIVHLHSRPRATIGSGRR